jgi:hypothetical protein
MNEETGRCVSMAEIKLTALPDNSTHHLSESLYGCELVVRPDTIVHLALSIAAQFREKRHILATLIQQFPSVSDWTDIAIVAPRIPQLMTVLDAFMLEHLPLQKPLVMQPIWKTEGRKQSLHQHAFDIFVWSNFAFSRLFFRGENLNPNTITRGARSIAWLARMLYDFALTDRIDHRSIIDSMSFNTRNDKAFAVNGMVTRPLMNGPELSQPRVSRSAVRNIILGGGQLLLSPERRLDAAILNTPGLFE